MDRNPMPIGPEIPITVLPDLLELLPRNVPRVLEPDMSLGNDDLLAIDLFGLDGLLVEFDPLLGEVAADVREAGNGDGDTDGSGPIETADKMSAFGRRDEGEEALDLVDDGFDGTDDGVVGVLDSGPDSLEKVGDSGENPLQLLDQAVQEITNQTARRDVGVGSELSGGGGKGADGLDGGIGSRLDGIRSRLLSFSALLEDARLPSLAVGDGLFELLDLAGELAHDGLHAIRGGSVDLLHGIGCLLLIVIEDVNVSDKVEQLLSFDGVDVAKITGLGALLDVHYMEADLALPSARLGLGGHIVCRYCKRYVEDRYDRILVRRLNKGWARITRLTYRQCSR